jgi:branched-subunit amino acid transport protein
MLLHNTYIYILIMALVTYLIRTLPLTLIRKEIKNTTIKSFLYYVPYVTLAVMTFPAILESTSSVISAAIAFVIAVVLAWMGKSLFQVAMFSCASVFIVELVMRFIAG